MQLFDFNNSCSFNTIKTSLISVLPKNTSDDYLRHSSSFCVHFKGRKAHLTSCMIIKYNICLFFFFFCPSPGRPDHAGPAADPRTDRHVAPGAAAEHPHPQRADSKDCRRGTLTVCEVSGRPRFLYFLHIATV